LLLADPESSLEVPMNNDKLPRKTVWEDIKGKLVDGQEYWVYRDKPWHTWEEQKDKYAKFADGMVRTFSGFEHMENIEFTTENYVVSHPIGGAEVQGQCRCLITFDAVPVYGFLCDHMTDALLQAHHCLWELRWLRSVAFGNLNSEKNLNHLINRPVHYREVPASVVGYEPSSGSVVLLANDEHEFPPESQGSSPTKSIQVDLLSKLIRWDPVKD
jgi:hypothetical protein